MVRYDEAYADRHFARVVDEALLGDRIILTRNGRDVAELTGSPSAPEWQKQAAIHRQARRKERSMA